MGDPDMLRRALDDVVTKITWNPDKTALVHDSEALNTLIGCIVMVTSQPALAASQEPESGGLDAETLARAYHATCCTLGGTRVGLQKGAGRAFHACTYRDAHRKSMTALAAEYARLREHSDGQ